MVKIKCFKCGRQAPEFLMYKQYTSHGIIHYCNECYLYDPRRAEELCEQEHPVR